MAKHFAHRGRLLKNLLAWYGLNARALPWRTTRDPYAIWVSEVILQQTRVEQGLPYYERFVATFPTVESLAEARIDRVIKLWEGLGYYTRARNLHRTAQLLVERHDGVFPEQVEALQLLPGIGRYTAGAIASLAFGQQAPVVDGNVKRVFSRIYNIEQSIDLAETEKRLWEIATGVVSHADPGSVNQALMELGAMICTPRRPACDECPVSAQCEARALGVQEARPVRSRKQKVPHREIVVAAIRVRDKYLVGKRPETGLLGGLWEFPGGKVEAGESHAEALRRECREELGLEVKVGGLIACVTHAYTHFKITMTVYKCSFQNGRPVPRQHTELLWLEKSQFGAYAFPKANHKFLHLL